VNYSDENLRQADLALERLYLALREVTPEPAPPGAASARFEAAMDDDLNTPEALAALQGLARDLNVAKSRSGHEAGRLAFELKALGKVLGILNADPDGWLKTAGQGAQPKGEAPRPTTEEIEALIAERSAARHARNWAESDRLRDVLAGRGVVLEDGPQGTTWRFR